MSLLTGDDFNDLFTTFAHTAFRLEVRDRYDMPDERADFEQWKAGIAKSVAADAEDMRPWLDMVRAAHEAGKRFERVRVVTEPLSDYIRFEAASAPLNIDAGEDIRYLPRRCAAEVPSHDYWLFDSRIVAYLHFTDDDQLLGAEIINDPAVVVEHCYWRDAAWHHAVPYGDYIDP